MSWNVSGKVAVVTGTSSRIGRAVAELLATRHGMKVACVSRRPPELALPAGCCAFNADVTSSKSCDDLFKTVATQLGGVSTVVCGAGVTLNKLLVRCNDDDYDLIMNANVRGSINVSRAALRYGGLLKQDAGSVVFVGSVVGVTGNAGQVLYSASKAALSGMAKSLAKEYGSKQVRFNVVSPGLVEGRGMSETLSAAQRAEWVAACPLGRLARAEDVADAVVATLLSPYVNGQVVSVDGGMS